MDLWACGVKALLGVGKELFDLLKTAEREGMKANGLGGIVEEPADKGQGIASLSPIGACVNEYLAPNFER